MQNGHGQIERRFGVGRVESPGFRRMPVDMQMRVQGGLHIRHGAAHLHEHAVGMPAGHGEAVGLGESRHGLVIRGRGSEPVGEFRRFQEMVIIRAGRVIQSLQQTGELRLVPQGKAEVQLQPVGRGQIRLGGEPADG